MLTTTIRCFDDNGRLHNAYAHDATLARLDYGRDRLTVGWSRGAGNRGELTLHQVTRMRMGVVTDESRLRAVQVLPLSPSPSATNPLWRELFGPGPTELDTAALVGDLLRSSAQAHLIVFALDCGESIAAVCLAATLRTTPPLSVDSEDAGADASAQADLQQAEPGSGELPPPRQASAESEAESSETSASGIYATVLTIDGCDLWFAWVEVSIGTSFIWNQHQHICWARDRAGLEQRLAGDGLALEAEESRFDVARVQAELRAGRLDSPDLALHCWNFFDDFQQALSTGPTKLFQPEQLDLHGKLYSLSGVADMLGLQAATLDAAERCQLLSVMDLGAQMVLDNTVRCPRSRDCRAVAALSGPTAA
jgi:hypothetical protein